MAKMYRKEQKMAQNVVVGSCYHQTIEIICLREEGDLSESVKCFSHGILGNLMCVMLLDNS